MPAGVRALRHSTHAVLTQILEISASASRPHSAHPDGQHSHRRSHNVQLWTPATLGQPSVDLGPHDIALNTPRPATVQSAAAGRTSFTQRASVASNSARIPWEPLQAPSASVAKVRQDDEVWGLASKRTHMRPRYPPIMSDPEMPSVPAVDELEQGAGNVQVSPPSVLTPRSAALYYNSIR